VHKIIKDAENLLLNMPNIRVCNLNDENEPGCIIVGDLHGSFNDLYHLIQKYDIPGKDYKFIFNGDYVDRGEKQIEVLIILLYLFNTRPDRIFLNRGNHEDISANTNANFSPNFMLDVRKKYGKYSSAIFNAACNMFSHFQMGTILTNLVNTRILIIHGGISDKIDYEYIRDDLDRHQYVNVVNSYKEMNEENRNDITQICDLLWSDPIREENGVIKPTFAKKATGCYVNKQRKLGSIFGHDITTAFCDRNLFSCIIRSHEVRPNGFSKDHSKCFTIFSASYYCGGNNMGAVLKLTPNETNLEPYSYKNLGGDISSSVFKKNQALIKQFKHIIQSNKSRILPLFENEDVEKTGKIGIEKWAHVLSEYFENRINVKNLIKIKDFLCECETTLNIVYYMTLFTKNAKRNKVKNENSLKVIKNLFDLLDADHNQRISISEFKEALMSINDKFGGLYSIKDDCATIISHLDLNHDNFIDLDEFSQAFYEDEFSLSNITDDLNESVDSETSEDGPVEFVRL
jgi:serine/threonine-protein phosphatase with EF-hand domain